MEKLKLNMPLNSPSTTFDFISFMSAHQSWGWPLYASHDSIFFPIEENPIPHGLKYEKGQLRYILSKNGNISALVGQSDNFFTIEDNGNAMCHYGTLSDPHFLECYSANDLPFSKDDDTVRDSVFKFIVTTINHGMFVVTRTSRSWHIYIFGSLYDAKRPLFREIYSLPSEKEVTAFTATGNEFFLALKNDGLKRYDIIMQQKLIVKEDTSFSVNAQITRDLDIKSLIASSAVNDFALYATVGDDRIYRFSMNGIPDFILKQ